MEELKNLDSAVIREKKSYDLPVNWKFKPVLCIADILERELFFVASETGPLPPNAARARARSFTLYLVNRTGSETLVLKRKAGFFVNKMDVFDGPENFIGSIAKRKMPATDCFQILDTADEVLYDVEKDPHSEEVFRIMKNSAIVGKISRQLTFKVEEGVSKRDHFGIVFPLDADVWKKSLLLGALLLIDCLY